MYHNNNPMLGNWFTDATSWVKNAATSVTAGAGGLDESKAAITAADDAFSQLTTALAGTSPAVQGEFQSAYDNLKKEIDLLKRESSRRGKNEFYDIGNDIKRANNLKAAIVALQSQVIAKQANPNAPPVAPPAVDEAQAKTTEKLSIFYPQRIKFKEPFTIPWWAYLVAGSAVAGVVYWRIRKTRR